MAERSGFEPSVPVRLLCCRVGLLALMVGGCRNRLVGGETNWRGAGPPLICSSSTDASRCVRSGIRTTITARAESTVHEFRFLPFESPAVASRIFCFFGQRSVTRRGGGGSLSSLRDSALGVTRIPCRTCAAFRTGNTRSPIRRGLPLLSPARSSHQFLLVRFPAVFHSSTTSSIRSATSAYPFSRNQWRARSMPDTVRFRYPPQPST